MNDGNFVAIAESGDETHNYNHRECGMSRLTNVYN